MKYKQYTIQAVFDIFARKKIKFFTPVEFSRLFALPASRVKYFLESNTRRGFFVRLKKGLYAVKNNYPAEEEIANTLYQPSYISLEYAMARYGIIPEMVYTVTSVTTMPTRSFSAGGKQYDYLTLKKQAYTGYHLHRENGRNFLIAVPEKSLADYLYYVSLGKKTLGDRIYVRNLDRKKLGGYSALFGRPRLFELIEKIYA